MARRSLGRQFGWLWAAYAVSAYGSGFGFGAFALIAIRVLHAGPAEVSALGAAGLAVGAAVAVPLGPWVEFRRKRPVMIGMDLARFAAMMSIPAAFALGWLTFAQLMIVSIVVAAAKIAFNSASGAYLKALVRPDDLLVANGRFESTNWTSVVVGPPLGGLAFGIFGPVTTVLADALSYLLSAVGISAIGGTEPRPEHTGTRGLRVADVLDGWRYSLASPVLRPLFWNRLTVNGLILTTEPLISVLMLGQLKFPPWQFGLAFAAPCIGGVIGSRLARRLAARFGQHRILRTAGALRVCWPLGLAFVRPGAAGLVLVLVVQFGLVLCCGIFNPVMATYRLQHTPKELVARTLSAWSVSSNAATAALIALGGVLATLTSTRTAIAVAGLLILATPLLLPRHAHVADPEPELAHAS
jgi:hypothetical protein